MGNESDKETHVNILLSTSPSPPPPSLSLSVTLAIAAILKICYSWKVNSNFLIKGGGSTRGLLPRG